MNRFKMNKMISAKVMIITMRDSFQHTVKKSMMILITINLSNKKKSQILTITQKSLMLMREVSQLITAHLVMMSVNK